ncbi:TIGR03087 family PEP-CTERM/XrtA system glycosyltransferase [Paraurantiacibacter namhicola]|uniref:Glycosyl transferases group 1 n=1 Tax=Paraurantiacibacter namhicola TaxID=645517 RepID=A0A1C7D9Z8_9SPHN|nr:TIGR03087 family PEP-CTERM/XrtA system glycosyltransferase [Paraurantiacibacter namhicola]ANU08133.1 Glycosyl transferases group 1 [Paraurantiacibacter namhicola]
MGGEILFLAHRMPFPPDRGDKIRSFHVLKALTRLAPVHVGTFAESADEMGYAADLARFTASQKVIRRQKPLVAAGIEALIHLEPVSVAAFRHAELSAWVEGMLAKGDIDTIYVFSGQMGQYIPASFKGRVIVDLVDVDSAKFEAYGKEKSGPVSWIEGREGRLLAREEERLAHRADMTLLVSKQEAKLLRDRMKKPDGATVEAMPNGIDSNAYSAERIAREAAMRTGRGPHLIFTGQMDYAPNVAAVKRVANRILPLIREEFPDAQFHVVGRAPTAELRALDGKGGMRVWGGVPEVKPYLAGANLALVPLEIARGVQNKVLEAMAMELPVVLTSGAATGIDAEDGVEFAVADDDTQLAERAIDLLKDRVAARTMGEAARRFVVDTMSWEASLSRLPAMLGRERNARRASRHAA